MISILSRNTAFIAVYEILGEEKGRSAVGASRSLSSLGWAGLTSFPLVASLLRRMPNTHRTAQNSDYVAMNKSVTLGQNMLGDVSPTGHPSLAPKY